MVFKALFDAELPNDQPNVVVVDPCFDAYKELAASAREGRIGLHLRSSGMGALKLARRLEIDAWIVAAELDDMSGHDFVGLLEELRGGARVAMVQTGAGEPGVDHVLGKPINCHDLEELLGLPAAERSRRLERPALAGSWVALPVSVGAAVVALAVLMIG
jgi:hypothetical protein